MGEEGSRDRLGRSEFIVLSLVAQRARGTHGTAMLDELREATGREWSVGALYTTLERLERKGFVASEWGEPSAQRGGRRKRIFRIQAAGQRALDQAYQTIDALASRRPGSRAVEA